jgi:hypothetical protein
VTPALDDPRPKVQIMADIISEIRQSHALEHATIAVLLERGIRPPLAGYSTPGGFFIFGRVSTEMVTRAAHEALHRLTLGQRELAVSPYCGTNLAVGAMLVAVLSKLLLRPGQKRLQRLTLGAALVVGATLLSRPLGQALQRRYTTLADVDGFDISSISRLKGGVYTLHRVNTSAATP